LTSRHLPCPSPHLLIRVRRPPAPLKYYGCFPSLNLPPPPPPPPNRTKVEARSSFFRVYPPFLLFFDDVFCSNLKIPLQTACCYFSPSGPFPFWSKSGPSWPFLFGLFFSFPSGFQPLFVNVLLFFFPHSSHFMKRCPDDVGLSQKVGFRRRVQMHPVSH